MMGPCLCGAPDCRNCHPENFSGNVYIAEMTDHEIELLNDTRDLDAENRAEDRREAIRYEQ